MMHYFEITIYSLLLRKLTPAVLFHAYKHLNKQGHDTTHYGAASVEKIHRSFCLLFFRSLRD